GSRHRLREPAQRPGRGRNARRHQARGKAPDRGRPADHHHRRQAGGGADAGNPWLKPNIVIPAGGISWAAGITETDMALSQSVEGCLEATIGPLGLPRASLDKNLKKIEPRLASLRKAYDAGTLPLLRVPEWRDDIETARGALKTLSHGARTLVFFG